MRRNNVDHAQPLEGDITVAALWLVFYLVVIFIAVSFQTSPHTLADMS